MLSVSVEGTMLVYMQSLISIIHVTDMTVMHRQPCMAAHIASIFYCSGSVLIAL